jgi:hypothetical protein
VNTSTVCISIGIFSELRPHNTSYWLQCNAAQHRQNLLAFTLGICAQAKDFIEHVGALTLQSNQLRVDRSELLTRAIAAHAPLTISRGFAAVCGVSNLHQLT